MWIVMIGNIVEGFRAVGPFSSSEEAIEWAEQEKEPDWTIMELEEKLGLKKKQL